MVNKICLSCLWCVLSGVRISFYPIATSSHEDFKVSVEVWSLSYHYWLGKLLIHDHCLLSLYTKSQLMYMYPYILSSSSSVLLLSASFSIQWRRCSNCGPLSYFSIHWGCSELLFFLILLHTLNHTSCLGGIGGSSHSPLWTYDAIISVSVLPWEERNRHKVLLGDIWKFPGIPHNVNEVQLFPGSDSQRGPNTLRSPFIHRNPV